MTYSLKYTVLAASELDAITKATSNLRATVRVRGIASVKDHGNGYWTVVLSVDDAE